MSAAESHLNEVLDAFDLGASGADIVRYGSGHINDTFLVRIKASRAILLQRVNPSVFQAPDKLMANIADVTDHLRRQIILRGGDPDRETLQILRPRSGKLCYTASDGGVWRAFPFIADSLYYDRIQSPAQFAACGRVLGRFQTMLRDYPVQNLRETISRFHDTPHRMQQLKKAIAADPCRRVSLCAAEIDFALRREEDSSVISHAQRAGLLPLRVTHNDTKISNFLFDRKTGDGLCLVDLDTVMPGLSVHDFGDAIRSGAHRSPEDAPADAALDMELYAVFTRAFLAEARDSLTSGEIEYLPWGARLMTLECGVRFLTDYLSGDTYFRTQREGQNLDRCRAQFRLLADMEAHWEEMRRITAL